MIVIAMMLFGLNLNPLYRAIAKVESDNGITSENIYQITRNYVDDVNRIYPSFRYRHSDVYDRFESETMMLLYWRYYAYMYSRETGKEITYETLARMHNKGGRYWTSDRKIAESNPYWNKVMVELRKETGLDVN